MSFETLATFWQSWRWLYPQVWLLLPLMMWVVFRAKYHQAWRYSGQKITLWAPMVTAKSSSNADSSTKRPLLTWLWFGALLLTLAALAHPQWKSSEKITRPGGFLPVILVVETSVSLVLQEGGQSRLAHLQTQVNQWLAQSQNLPMALVIYGDVAQTWLLPTTDAQLVTFQMGRLQPALAGRQDTATLWALYQALQLARAQPASRILWITDGISSHQDEQIFSQLTQAWQNEDVDLKILALGTQQQSQQDAPKTPGLVYQPLELDSLTPWAQALNGQILLSEDGDAWPKISQWLIEKPQQSQQVNAGENWQGVHMPFVYASLAVWLWILLQMQRQKSRRKDHAQLDT